MNHVTLCEGMFGLADNDQVWCVILYDKMLCLRENVDDVQNSTLFGERRCSTVALFA